MLINHLKSYFNHRQSLLLIYLFGSQGRGDTHAHSDIDLAFLFSKDLSLEEHAALVTETSRLLGREDIDVVLLQEAPPLLKFDVVSEGELIYQNVTDDFLNDFELHVIKECFDTEPLRRIQNQYLKERILGIPSGF